MELTKATLQEISSDDPPRELGDPIAVQFNPSSLRLQLSNQVEGGKSRGRQNRQFLGSSSTQLTLDLVFDSADEGSDAVPRSVREKTALVEKFVVPRIEGESKQAPPKLRFQWGRLVLDGLVDSVNIDFDHFAADGTPLRARVGLTIREQDSKYQFLESGPGANRAGNAPAPGAAASGAPGSSGSGGDRSGLSLGGESAADFAARMGVDPAAWRGLAAGLDATVSLEAGVEIGFSANLNAGAGLGVSLGAQAGAALSLEASLGLDAGVGAVAGVGAGASLASGFNLSAAGGVGPALESVKIARSQTAQQQARNAFSAPPASTAPASSATTGRSRAVAGATARAAPLAPGTAHARPGLPEQPRQPLARTGLPAAGAAPASAPLPPKADLRAVSFAFGVPLRPTLGAAAEQRADAAQGSISLRPKTASGDPPLTDDPTTPGWIALPEPTRSRRSTRGGVVPSKKPCNCGPCGGK
jgi:hypothetical protein